jgi:hypothetical protein
MSRCNNPYNCRVSRVAPFVVVVVNSEHCLKIPLPHPDCVETAFLWTTPKSVFHLVALCHFDAIDLPCDIILKLNSANGKVQKVSLSSLEYKNNVVDFESFSESPVVGVFVTISNIMSKHSRNEECLFEKVLDIFHNTRVNPALGALKVRTLFHHVVTARESSLTSCLFSRC